MAEFLHLNTSHVKVQQDDSYCSTLNFAYLNTSHVKVQSFNDYEQRDYDLFKYILC